MVDAARSSRSTPDASASVHRYRLEWRQRWRDVDGRVHEMERGRDLDGIGALRAFAATHLHEAHDGEFRLLDADGRSIAYMQEVELAVWSGLGGPPGLATRWQADETRAGDRLRVFTTIAASFEEAVRLRLCSRRRVRDAVRLTRSILIGPTTGGG